MCEQSSPVLPIIRQFSYSLPIERHIISSIKLFSRIKLREKHVVSFKFNISMTAERRRLPFPHTNSGEADGYFPDSSTVPHQ